MKLNSSNTRPLSQNSSFLQFPKQQTPPKNRYATSSPRNEIEDLNRMTLEEINRELDSNSNQQYIQHLQVNEIIQLLNRRRSLIMNKKRRLKEEFQNKINEIRRYSTEQFNSELSRVEDPLVQQLMNQKNLNKMQKMLSTVLRQQQYQDKKINELNRSQEFWQYNKNIELEIDNLLKRLKQFDMELDRDNSEIHETCCQLDVIDDGIKDLLISKVEDHVQRAEPLFANKQKQQQILNHKLQQRNKLKDEKMNLIYQIIEELLKLRNFREERLNKINQVFGEEPEPAYYSEQHQAQPQQQPQSKLQQYIDFIDQLENMNKIKDQIHKLEMQEGNLLAELDRVYKENDQIFNELIRKVSEEAKFFNDWTENLKRRLRLIKANEYFIQQTQIPDTQQMDMKDTLKKFKENITFLRPLIDEENTIRTGMYKTADTIQSFKNIIKAIQNEKERRRELLNILENCARLKQDEDLKTEYLRNAELEINKKNQQKRNLEEDLDGVLGDADLNTFKKIEQQLNGFDQELLNLNQQRKNIGQEIEEINQYVISQLAMMKNDYDDILKEILPNNWASTYDLKKINDLKHMKNYLKKTFKRFGILQ